MMALNNSALFLGISLGSLIGGEAMALSGFDANVRLCAAISVLAVVAIRLGNPPAGIVSAG